MRELEWSQVLIFGTLAGVLMPVVLSGGSSLFLFAGVVPVGAGLLIGRRVKAHYALHGFMAGLLATVVALVVLTIVLFYTPLGEVARTSMSSQSPDAPPLSLSALWLQLAVFTSFSLLLFCSYGAWMTGRTQERNRAVQKELDDRGGRLERASAVRTADDIRGLTLPQFGWYVNNLFKKKGFTFKDYRFVDKEKHVDLWMEHEGELWHLRCTVADKVNPGTIESLYQKMKEEGCRKGVVVTSTEFTPGAIKAAKNRPIVTIDGATLYTIAEG